MKRITSIPPSLYRLQGKKAAKFFEKWDNISVGEVASRIPNLSYKTTSSGKVTFACLYHEDDNDSACIIPKKPGDKCAVYYCSVCGSLPLFEFYADQIKAQNGGEATVFACEDFSISKEFSVVGVKNSAAKTTSGETGSVSKSQFTDPELSEEFLDEMHIALMADQDAVSYIGGEKGITEEILVRYKVGWFDRGKGDKRYIIPIRDVNGTLINYRQYNPKRKPKWIGLKDIKSEGIFPHDVDESLGPVIIVEGEGDALCARSKGINAYTGTAGAGMFADEWCSRFSGINVTICYDNDSTGFTGSILAGEKLLHHSSSVKVLKSPSKKPKGDISDWFVVEGGTKEKLLELIENCKIFDGEDSLDESHSEVDFIELHTMKPGSRVNTKMKIFQIDTQAGMISSRVIINCQRGTKRFCNECPALIQEEFIIPTNPQNINYMQTHQITTDEGKLKKMLGLCCGEIQPEFDNRYNLYRCSIHHPESPFTDVSPIEDCVIVSDENIEIVNPAMFEAQVEIGQFPKAGAGRGIKFRTHFAFKPKRIQTEEEKFDPVLKQNDLTVFSASPGKVKDKLLDIYEDLESKIAIYDRKHAVIVADLCFLSAKEISVQQGIFTEKIKGVLEVALFGSTRTGKTKIAERLSQLYRFGQMYDCANLSHAALVGMASSTRNGGRFSPGILPKSDGSLIILDEADKYPEEQKFQKLTATRSSGIARYNKLDQSRAMPARVRVVWIANPPRGHKMEDYTYPFEIFRDVMIQDSAVSRFDFAIPVVSKEFIRKSIKDKKRYSINQYRMLSLFARSLTADQIEIEDEADAFINQSANELFSIFGKDKGPVSNDIEEKIMRVATAIAIRTFAFNLTEKKLKVTREHAEVAIDWMIEFHSADTCGYDKMHQLEKELETTVRDFDSFYEAVDMVSESEMKIMCDTIVKNIGRIEFDKDLIVSMFPQKDYNKGQEFFTLLLSSGAIFSFKGESSKFRTRYKFSRDGIAHIKAAKEVGLNKMAIKEAVKEDREAEQLNLTKEDDVVPF